MGDPRVIYRALRAQGILGTTGHFAMNVQLLVDSIVRQTTVLIAQLATSGGIRAPVAHIANQVFLELAKELEAQGVSRKVSADMFGMALRAYVRKVRRLGEGQTECGKTLWQTVLDFIRREELVTRDRILERFDRDDELQVSSVLHDLTESSMVFCSGSGKHAVFRAATDAELGRLAELEGQHGLDEFAWVLVFRHGPLADEKLAELLGRKPEDIAALIERLIAQGRVQRGSSGKLGAPEFVILPGATAGWEAAVFDHFQAVVQTVCQRLRANAGEELDTPAIGGSTYTYDIWQGHPLEVEVTDRLGELRRQCHELRKRVEEYNRTHGVPDEYRQIVTYVGQCVLEREAGEQKGEA
ncbi:MAG TPA: hypothetical protein VKP30_26805 [Polyangiaceae bacterium]|nr:hypothetical protein [Polyangiaceae bacterium]